jgi:hypothetical protein
MISKAYEAKLASKNCIIQRLSLAQLEIHALEKQSDFLQAMQGGHNDELSAVDDELNCMKSELTECGVTLQDHIAFGHAVYSGKLVALTIADMQLRQISGAVNPRMYPDSKEDLSSDSDFGSSDTDLLDDLIYEEDKHAQ